MSFKLSAEAEEDIIAIAEQGAVCSGQARQSDTTMNFSHYLI
ncbi:hypothetical protein ACVMIX_006411 [Rhizobium leguminosarum]|jgi:hypothetical protein